jgi:hypothetical protein
MFGGNGDPFVVSFQFDINHLGKSIKSQEKHHTTEIENDLLQTGFNTLRRIHKANGLKPPKAYLCELPTF